MYYTLTLNPAIDYIVNVDNFREGFLNRTFREKFLPGGKGINVSIVLSNFSMQTTALGFVAGFTGFELERLLKEKNVKTDFVHLKEGNTRINVKLKTSTETEINGNGPEISEKALEELYTKLGNLNNEDFLILSGSVPKTLPDTIYCEVAEYISAKKVNIVIDAEKDLVTKTLKYNPFLIKPNHHELEDIFGKKLTSTKDILDAAHNLQHMGARNIFISMAGKGGVFLGEDKKAFYCPAPQGKVINSTGAGDSALAGFLAQYSKEKNYIKAFTMGICAGSAAAFSETLALQSDAEILHRNLGECIEL